MSTWNEEIKYFSEQESTDLAKLLNIIGFEGWDKMEDEVFQATNGQIVAIFVDEMRCLINAQTDDYNSTDKRQKYFDIAKSIIGKYIKEAVYGK